MQKVKIDDLLTFTRQLSYLVKMKFPLGDSLKYMARESPGSMKEALEIVDGRIQKGEGLSRSLSSFRNNFASLYGKMIEIGESTDSLDRVLAQLTDYLEFNRRIIKEVNGALAYPFAAFTFILCEIFVILNFVLPGLYQMLNGLFSGMSLSIPLVTRIFLSFMKFYQQYQLGWLLIIFIILINCWQLIPGLQGDRLRMVLPFIGRLFRTYSFARFARSMALLLAARTPLHEALDYAAKGMDNAVAAIEIGKLRDEVRKGKTLSSAMAGSRYFSPTFTWMVSCGEKREDLPEIMMEISEYYDREARSSIKTSLGFLEPVALILLGQIVAFFVVAVFLPLYQVIGSF